MASKLFQGTAHASVYVKFRPTAPVALVEHVLSYLEKEVSSNVVNFWAN